MFWLKAFEKYFIGDNRDNIYDHFRMIQYEYIIKDLSNAKYLIYCWMTQNKENIKECSMDSIKDKMSNYDNVHAASSHIWSVEMSWKERGKFMEIFIPCNKRLDDIIHKRKHLVLGEWNSYNKQYENEKLMEHNDSVLVDYPERNTKTVNNGAPPAVMRRRRDERRLDRNDIQRIRSRIKRFREQRQEKIPGDNNNNNVSNIQNIPNTGPIARVQRTQRRPRSDRFVRTKRMRYPAQNN